MTFKYNNVYLNEVSTVVGPYEEKGPLKGMFDKSYNNLYFGTDSWEKAEVKGIVEGVNILLDKLNKKSSDIDVHIGSDLLNQIVATNYASSALSIPLIGIYSACSSSTLGMILASNMIESKQIKNSIITSSCNNNSAEKQYRNPVEYGGPKKKYTTFTTTGVGTCYLSSTKSNIKVESGTIGTVVDMGITDISNMGAVMAPAAAKTIYDHLKETNRSIEYYDLILTGDLGIVGKNILKEYIKKEYNINLKNYDDCGCIIYDTDNPESYAGGSGPACLPLVAYTKILNKMKNNKLNKVLLVATGALMNTCMTNEKLTIPAIAHAISLEAIK